MYTLIIVVLSLLLVLFVGFVVIISLWESLDNSHTPDWLNDIYYFIVDIIG